MLLSLFVFKATGLLDEANLDLMLQLPECYLPIVQGLIEDLTVLVEEYEGVLDGSAEHDDNG